MNAGNPRAPAITVVVVNFNGGDYLRRCMASLAVQTFADFEVILVDNASTDGSLETLAELPSRTTILRETVNHGFAVANNLAVDRSRAKWIALLNPDAEAESDWLEVLMHAVTDRPTHRVVACLQIATHDASILDGAGDCYLAYGYAWRGGFGRSIKDTPADGECFAPCGAAALYPRDTFVQSGGFDPRYFCYHEDVDLGFKMRWLGERCQFVKGARVRHVGSGITGRASDFAVFHGSRNGLWTYVKNMPLRLLVITSPVWFFGTLAILGRGLMTGRFGATLRGLKAAFGDLGPALADRRRLKKLRKVSVADIAKSLSWNPFRFLARKPDVRRFEAGDV